MLLIRRIGFSAGMALAVCLACSSVTSGQTTPGPPHPVFGQALATGSATQSADATLSLEEAYETNTVGALNVPTETPFRASGFYSTLKGDASFIENSDHIKFAASAGSNVRYYPNLREVVPINHSAGGAFTGEFFHRTTVSVSEMLAYAPSYLYGLFPGATTPVPGLVSTAGADYALSTVRSYTDATTVTMSQRLTSRATATFGSSYRSTVFKGALVPSNITSYDFAGHFAYRVTRTGTFRFGYTYRDGQYGSGFRAKEQGVDVGVDLDRALSRTRRATVRFNVASTLVRAPAQADVHIGPALRQQYGMVGNGAVSYDIGSTWHAQGSVNRGVMFVEGFAAPLTSSGVGAEVAGFINRNLDVLASGAYARGQSTFVTDGSVFNTRTVDVRLRYALSRTWATYVEYLYYYYRFDQAMLLSPLFGPSLDRSGLHVGLTLWTGMRRK
jgi:hypothetical protein